MGDVDERDLDGLEGAIVVEIEAGELADAQFAVDVHESVDFFAAVAVFLEAVLGFEKLELRGIWSLGGSWGACGGFFGWLLRSLLGLSETNS